MASTINASSTANGIVSTADASGILNVQSNGVNTNLQAWITYNGVSKTILASYNVSSVTYNSTGNYTLNFTNAFVDANYGIVFGICGGTTVNNSSFVGSVIATTQYGAPSNKTTSACQVQFVDYTATVHDFTQVYMACFR